MIENMLHKHRYFGHSGEIYESCPWSVTTVSPMKRGLKAINSKTSPAVSVGYNRFPDEKGTESCDLLLKSIRLFGYNRFPDEKGTESTMRIPATSLFILCYNRFPDEKGTERYSDR